MSLFKRCDSCSADLSVAPDPAALLDVVVYRIGATDPLNFCSWQCLTDYAAARGLADVAAEAQS